MQVSSYTGWIKKYGRLCLLVLLLCSQTLPARADGIAAADEVLWKKANALYTQKQYDSAAMYYNRLLQAYPRNALLQYNTGNTYYRLNKVGQAVLHFEKAAFLDPRNKEIKDNLLLAKGRIQSPVPEAAPIFFVSWWNSLVRLFSSNTWAVLSLLAFGAILTLVYLARVRKERFTHSGRWLSLAIAGLLIFGCMTWFSYDALSNSRRAVVLQPAANLTDAPRASAKVLGSLSEGTVVEVYGTQGNYINIKLPNGREGWIAAGAVEKV